MRKWPFIRKARQKRAIEVLLANESVQVNDLGPLIGASNPRQTIMELRRQGFLNIILTRRFQLIDRDGKECQPGEYYIPLESKHIAEEALKRYTAHKDETYEAVQDDFESDDNMEGENDSKL